MTHTASLSPNDVRVLANIFTPTSLNSIVDRSIPESLPGYTADSLPPLQAAESAALHILNVPRPPPSALYEAIEQLCRIISEHPDYASAYNNRAQAITLLLGDDLFHAPIAQSTLWTDLDNAIRLATPPAEQTVGINPFQAAVLSAAYTQRGKLVWRASQTLGKLAKNADLRAHNAMLPEELRARDEAGLEEWASRDLETAGRYGNAEAAEMAKLMNPYARLCGQIVERMMYGEMHKCVEASAVL
jgi:hypothetical protein